MQTSPAELSRLGKLAEYQILDTPPEKEFDEIVQVAAALLGTPMSTVSLIDRERQWFKARYGVTGTETPREYAFCDHAIKGDGVYVVTDATKNPLFSDNPLVTGAPDIRFYAGAPLITSDNFKLGTLCVIDTAPRDHGLSADHQRILELLARMVVNALESRRATMRAQHQGRMMTRMAEGMVGLSQAATVADVGRILTDTARGLVVADAAYFEVIGDDQKPTVATRTGSSEAPAGVPWKDRGAALMVRKSFAPATPKDVGGAGGDGAKGAWIGMLIGLTIGAPKAHFQLWRQYTTSFTEYESAMLADLARVASGAVEHLSKN